ncbi:MAG: 50S ribosomal protein L10, partial [Caldilinea sp.]
MAISRQKKEELVAQYKELIANSSALVFTNYQGITVSQIRSLRSREIVRRWCAPGRGIFPNRRLPEGFPPSWPPAAFS